MKIYALDVSTNVFDARVLFREPPVRRNIVEYMRHVFYRLQPSTQDIAWDILILAHSSPEIPFLGDYENLAGKLTVTEWPVVEN